MNNAISAARRGVLVIFFLHGLVFATWVSRIPSVKSALGLSTGRLGLALLGIAAGCIISMPLTGFLVSRVGSRPVTSVSTLVFAAALALPGFADSQGTLTAALCVLGVAAGAMDVSMNAHGVAVERVAGRPFMSGFHALFSIGGMAGSAVGGVVAGVGVTPRVHFLVAAAAAFGIALTAIPLLLPGHVDAMPRERGKFRLSATLAGLSALAFCFFLAEGAIADWSALYLHLAANMAVGTAAAGYALFSAAMALGRISGDALRHRFQPQVLVAAGSSIAALGLSAGLAFPPVALAGFAVVGAGCSIVVPIAFASSGKLHGVSPGPAIAAMTSCGYVGLFVGPPLIGFAAQAITLRAALLIVVVLTAVGVPLAYSVRSEVRTSR